MTREPDYNKARALLLEALNIIHTGKSDTLVERRTRQAYMRVLYILEKREESISKAHPITEVEFRYGPDWARIDSEMQEPDVPEWPF